MPVIEIDGEGFTTSAYFISIAAIPEVNCVFINYSHRICVVFYMNFVVDQKIADLKNFCYLIIPETASRFHVKC
jgi:hypothetical protein